MIWSKIKLHKNLLITVAFLWLGHFCVDFMLSIWTIYKTMAELDLATAGLISTFCAFTGEGMQLIFGSLSDKGYRKHLIVFGILATTSATLLAYFDHYAFFCLIFLVTCLGSGAFHPAAASWMGSLTQNYKGFFITVFTCGGTLGIALSQIIFYQSFYYFQGHTLFLAIPVVLLVVFLVLSRQKPTEKNTDSSHEKFNLKIIRNFFRRKELALLYISQVCNQSICWGSIFLLPDILLSRQYESWISFGGGHLSFIMGSFFMQPLAGYLADRYSCRSVILSATAAGMIAFYVFLFNPLLSPPVLLVLLFLLGACLGLVNPLSLAWGTRLVPDNPGMISAFLMGLVWCVSEGIGQGGGGLLSKLFVDDAPAKGLAIIGSMSIVGFTAVLRMPKESAIKSASMEQI